MWRRLDSPPAWNAALDALDSPHVLQSWEWGDFKSRWGWTAERWMREGESGGPRAAIQVLQRQLARLPARVLYAPKGPTVSNLEALCQSLAWLESQGRRRRAVWVKIDGDPPTGVSLEEARAALRSRGWRYSPNQVQFRNTAHTDLRRPDDALLADMKPKWRYNIRLAEKRGVVARPAAPGEEDLLYDLYAETGRRDGFAVRERAYYHDAWRTMGAAGFIAEHDGRALAGLVLFRCRDRAWYFYGMSRSGGREHMPNHLLQWTAMRWARDQGCAVYDWWGAPDALEEADPLWGVYRFKEGFGARFVEGLGAWDYAPSSLLYRAFLKLYRTALVLR
jgi:lipid II:glycine glycyltransferase (peptidoglycan interpeptide bridge formation enzyme)